MVIKLLAKRIPFTSKREGLKHNWKPQGLIEIMDIDNGFHMVKFDNVMNRERILSGGLWMLIDHYVVVRQWSPYFI